MMVPYRASEPEPEFTLLQAIDTVGLEKTFERDDSPWKILLDSLT